MQKFKCGYCGCYDLFIEYDAAVTHKVIGISHENCVEVSDPIVTDYMDYFYAVCGDCGEEIYQGKHESSLIEHLKETGQLVEE